MQVKSTVKMNMPRIQQLTRAAVTALEMTAEALHTEVIQAQVVPFDTGNLQNESFFADYSDSSKGKVQLVNSTPYARRRASIRTIIDVTMSVTILRELRYCH